MKDNPGLVPHTSKVAVEFDTAHVGVYLRRAAVEISKRVFTDSQGVNTLVISDVESALKAQLDAGLEVAGVSHRPVMYGVISDIATVFEVLRGVTTTGTSTTVKYVPVESKGSTGEPKKGKAGQAAGPASEEKRDDLTEGDAPIAEASKAFYRVEQLSESLLWAKTVDVQPGSGSLAVLQATAEWVGDSCYVYTRNSMTADELLIVAALNVQGFAKSVFGSDPDVSKLLVVDRGHLVTGVTS